MRILLLCLFFAFSSALFGQQTPIGGIGNSGGGPKQSWRDIMKNPNLKAIFPSYNILDRNIQYNRLCLNGEKVRTIYKFVVDEFSNHSKIIYDYLEVDRVREVEKCATRLQDQCIEWEYVTVEIPYEQKIKVFKKAQTYGPRQTWEIAFEKDFELPECEGNSF